MATTNTMAMKGLVMTRRRRRRRRKKKKKKSLSLSLSLSLSFSLIDWTEKFSSSSSLFLQKFHPQFLQPSLLLVLVLLVNAPVCRPDPSRFRPMPTTDIMPITPEDESTPPLTIILTLILLVFLFIGFFSIYFCRCLMDAIVHSRNLRRTPSGNLVGPSSSSPAPTGLDPLLIKSFPTFPYSSIKDFRSDKLGLECAICLLEFEDDSFLRLLTLCSHVFHQECIDLWLESHKTCPVCRRNLDSDSPRNSADKPPPDGQNSDHESIEDAISIEIDDDDDEEEDEEEDEDVGAADDPSGSSRSKRTGKTKTEEGVKKFSRSHSTGHSIVKCKREVDDKYTLRLPEHIKIKLIRGHNWTGSCVTFDEFSRNPAGTCNGNGGGFLEVTSSDSTNNSHKPP